jgi:hypothetical protein
MKKFIIASSLLVSFLFCSCGNHSEAPASATDTVSKAGPDSAANNGILPPSAAPGNAGNSSLADTAYHKIDSTQTK